LRAGAVAAGFPGTVAADDCAGLAGGVGGAWAVAAGFAGGLTGLLGAALPLGLGATSGVRWAVPVAGAAVGLAGASQGRRWPLGRTSMPFGPSIQVRPPSVKAM
jgi:hypothetical protein